MKVERRTARLEMTGRLKWLAIILFLIWLAFALSSYYLVQNAFLQPVIRALVEIDSWLPLRFTVPAFGRNVLNVVAALWITFIALGIGRWTLKALRLPELAFLEEALFATGLGFGLLGFGVLVVGLAGLLRKPVLLVGCALLTILTFSKSVRFLRNARIPRAKRTLLGYFALTASLALTLALLPPTSWDALFYHLTGPKLYLQAGQIVQGVDIPHLNFPSLFEMLFALGMAVRGDVTAVLLHFVFLFLLAGLTYIVAGELLQIRTAWLAVLFLLAMPMVRSLSSWAYNDLALAFFELGALYALLKWQRHLGSERTGLLVLSAVFSGLAMGLKYTSFVAPLTLALFIIWWNRRELANAVRILATFAAIALLVASPWFLKNLAFTGNPVYPFLFGGRYWDDFRAAAYSESGTGIAFDPDTCKGSTSEFLVGQHVTDCELDLASLARRVAILPYDLTLGLRDASRDGDPGPLFLIFLPLLLFYGASRSHKGPVAFNALLFFALAQYAFWTIGVMFSASLWQSRLLLPAFVALCPVLAWLLEDLARYDHARFSLQRQLLLVIGAVLIVGLLVQAATWTAQQPWAYLTGAETEKEYLQRRLGPHYLAMLAINEQLPTEAKIAFLWEPRSYYCQRDCQPDSILDSFGHLQFQHGNADGIAQAWRAAGVSHVLLFRGGLNFILQANAAGSEPLTEPLELRVLRQNHLEPLATIGDDVYELYRLRS